MALIVEDGSIVTGADSYISLADAVTFVDSVYGEYDDNATAFLGYSTTRQEQIMRKAAWYLDIYYRGEWKGFKRQQAQALDWPRTDVIDEDGYDVPEDDIPTAIQRAQVEIAVRLANDIAIFEDRSRGGLVKSEKVDVISVTYLDSAPARTLFEEIRRTVAGLLRKDNRVVRA